MSREWKIRQGLLMASLCLAAAAGISGDTIVLKNGRRIKALSVTQEGDKISYETPSGTLILPRAIVDHVERGGVPSAEASANASTLSLKPPDTAAAASVLSPNKSEIETRVILDGEVDRNYVAQLEGEARSGEAVANHNAALRHQLSWELETGHGEMDLALAEAPRH